MTIIEFLEARIAEDEAEARKYQQYEKDVWETAGWWEPTRVLAECTAKRAIIEQAQNATEAEKEYDDYEWQGTVSRSEPWTGDAILLSLTAVYKDHPDYQQLENVGVLPE